MWIVVGSGEQLAAVAECDLAHAVEVGWRDVAWFWDGASGRGDALFEDQPLDPCWCEQEQQRRAFRAGGEAVRNVARSDDQVAGAAWIV